MKIGNKTVLSVTDVKKLNRSWKKYTDGGLDSWVKAMSIITEYHNSMQANNETEIDFKVLQSKLNNYLNEDEIKTIINLFKTENDK